jgi:hypothetical protein
MSWRSCGNRSRRVSYEYNLAGVLNLNAIADLALQVMVARDSDRVRQPPAITVTGTTLISQLSSSAPGSAAVSCFSLDTGPHPEY